MSKILATNNFFLDTSVFEENNFFHGGNIHDILYYSQIGVINIYMTSISKMELIDRMKTHLTKCKSEHNKFVKSLNNHDFRILRNIDFYNDLRPSSLKVTEGLEKLKSKLEINIKLAKIKIIQSDKVNADEIFRLYYSSKPPFSEGKKKYEFPDAIIIKTLDDWCLKNKKRIYVISNDNDFNHFKSYRLIFRNNLSSMLSVITKFYDEKYNYNILPSIKKSLKNNEQPLLQLIKDLLITQIEIRSDYEKISPISINKINLNSYQVTSIRKEFAEVEYIVDIKCDFFIFPTYNDISKSDFEDSLNPVRVPISHSVPVNLEINYNKINDIKVKWVNSQFPIVFEVDNSLKIFQVN
jgi:hypothetical protein